MNQLAINTVGDELEASADYCRSRSIGLEITDFAFPENLDSGLSARINRHAGAVDGISPVISHGPCFDLIAASRDPEIIAVTRHRHETALAASREIGASIYVAHTNFMPQFKFPGYREFWTKRTLDFWLPFADRAGKDGMIICLENVWEPIPDIQSELITVGNHPHLRATLDNGHTLVFSNIQSNKWVETLGPVLAHCHLHDNSGEYDEHKPVGEGKENWEELMAAFRDYAPNTILVAENGKLVDNKISITRLRDFQQE